MSEHTGASGSRRSIPQNGLREGTDVRRFVLDTSVLIRHWRNCRVGQPLIDVNPVQAEEWARKLIQIEQADSIVTPVYLEFVSGARDRTELHLARAYLKPFSILDRGTITAADWNEARRLAERIPPSGRPRDLGDCLIKAVATRLGFEVRTFDTGMPR